MCSWVAHASCHIEVHTAPPGGPRLLRRRPHSAAEHTPLGTISSAYTRKPGPHPMPCAYMNAPSFNGSATRFSKNCTNRHDGAQGRRQCVGFAASTDQARHAPSPYTRFHPRSRKPAGLSLCRPWDLPWCRIPVIASTLHHYRHCKCPPASLSTAAKHPPYRRLRHGSRAKRHSRQHGHARQLHTSRERTWRIREGAGEALRWSW